MKTAAFFDVDHTLIKGNTGRRHSAYFALRFMIKPWDFLRIVYFIFLYQINSINYEKAMTNAYLKAVKGWDVKKTKAICKKFYKRWIKHLIYSDMRKIIQQHKKNNRLIVFVTTAWDVTVERIAEELKADVLIATKVEEKNNKFTGKLVHRIYGRSKKQKMLELAKQKKIDMKNSFAYTDHISDLPMLEAVGNPVVISPGRKLLKIAKARKWKVLYPK